MEKAIHGGDWSRVNKRTKHLYASRAKKLYKDYWDDYFKFSFVRNPWDRTLSLLRFPVWFGLKLVDGKVNVNSYLLKFPRLEKSPHNPSLVGLPCIKKSVYLNILNEKLDFIGRYEQLDRDFEIVCDKLKIKQTILPKINVSSRHKKDPRRYSEYYDDKTRKQIADRYATDINFFEFKFDEKK